MLIALAIGVREDYHIKLYNKLTKPLPTLTTYIEQMQESQKYIQMDTKCDSLQRQCNIVMLGDSQTANNDWGMMLERTDILNASIGGDFMPAMKTRLTKLVELKPRICFIQGGVNDILGSLGLDASINAYK